MDGTPLDVLAVMDDGVPGRPELVAAIDIATRTLCAAILRPVGAKAVDSAVLLARMMVPEPMRPGWDKALAVSASRIPYKRLATVDERIELAAAKPVIIPDTVVIDHGRVFLSEVFLRAAGRVCQIFCARGLFAVRFRMFIRCLFFALSDVPLPVLSGGPAEPGIPCRSGTDAARPGYRAVLLIRGAAALSRRITRQPFRLWLKYSRR
jgi:hypothetical protein